MFLFFKDEAQYIHGNMKVTYLKDVVISPFRSIFLVLEQTNIKIIQVAKGSDCRLVRNNQKSLSTAMQS